MENEFAPNTTITLTGLNEYTNYSITVFASTIKGGGNKSVPIVVITDEDSKFSQHFMFLLLSINGHNSPASSADSLCCEVASWFLIRLQKSGLTYCSFLNHSQKSSQKLVCAVFFCFFFEGKRCMKGRNFSLVDVRSWKEHTNFSCHIYLLGPLFLG